MRSESFEVLDSGKNYAPTFTKIVDAKFVDKAATIY